MIRRDMREVIDIEKRCFDHPWTEEDFLRCLRQRNCIGMVAEDGENVVGFFIYELHKQHIEIVNLAVHTEWQRNGIGSHMIAKLIGKLGSHRRTRIIIRIGERNLDAQLWFRSQGFRATKILHNYFDGGDDAYEMQLAIKDEIAVQDEACSGA